jgi:hypothetical protein
VIAAYRRGLIAAEHVPDLAADIAPLLPDGAQAWAAVAGCEGAGLDDLIHLAAQEIDYAPTADEERAEVVDRLVYTALAGKDVRTSIEILRLIAPGSEAVKGSHDGDVFARMSGRRAAIESYYEAAHAVDLAPGVHRHFDDPTVRAGRLLSAYRRDWIGSADLPGAAAELLMELPAAGAAWTELAGASSKESRWDLEPIVERAAAEIGFDGAAEVAVLIEYELYRGLVDGDVVRRAGRIWALDDASPFGEPWILDGHQGDVGIGRFLSGGAELLNERYGDT